MCRERFVARVRFAVPLNKQSLSRSSSNRHFANQNPERGQPFGNNATQSLKDSILGNVVKVVSHDQDKYGRTIGDIYHNGTLINLALVKAGLAWHYVKYAPDDTALREAEQQARRLETGLWSGSHKIIPPWDWRKMSNQERNEHR